MGVKWWLIPRLYGGMLVSAVVRVDLPCCLDLLILSIISIFGSIFHV
jgi:hypothetical protein